MESEKEEVEKAGEEKPPTPDERIARSLNGIKDALFIIVFIMLMGQCTSGLGGKSEETKALDGIEFQLRLSKEELRLSREAAQAVGAQLREANKNLSEINGTIWNKSCSR